MEHAVSIPTRSATSRTRKVSRRHNSFTGNTMARQRHYREEDMHYILQLRQQRASIRDRIHSQQATKTASNWVQSDK